MATPNDVVDTYDAEKFPVSKLLSQNGQPYALTHLASPPSSCTSPKCHLSPPAPVITAIRAFAFIPKKHIVCETAEAAAIHLATVLVDSLSNSVSTHLVDHTIAALAPQIAVVHSESEALAMMAQKTEDNLTTTLDKAEKLRCLVSDERTEHKETDHVPVLRFSRPPTVRTVWPLHYI